MINKLEDDSDGKPVDNLIKSRERQSEELFKNEKSTKNAHSTKHTEQWQFLLKYCTTFSTVEFNAFIFYKHNSKSRKKKMKKRKKLKMYRICISAYDSLKMNEHGATPMSYASNVISQILHFKLHK